MTHLITNVDVTLAPINLMSQYCITKLALSLKVINFTITGTFAIICALVIFKLR